MTSKSGGTNQTPAKKAPGRKVEDRKQRALKETAHLAGRGRGQPTMYDPAFCERVVECAAAGGTLDSFAAAVRVARSTLTRWAHDHEDFSAAIARAKTALAARLHGECMATGNAPSIAYRLKLLANMAPEDFRDRTEVSVGGTPGAPPIPVADLSSADALARYMALSQRAAK